MDSMSNGGGKNLPKALALKKKSLYIHIISRDHYLGAKENKVLGLLISSLQKFTKLSNETIKS